jgi:hypothetical protein
MSEELCHKQKPKVVKQNSDLHDLTQDNTLLLDVKNGVNSPIGAKKVHNKFTPFVKKLSAPKK